MHFGFGFASCIAAIFALGALVVNACLIVFTNLLSWGVDKGINAAASGKGGEGRAYERIRWEGGATKAAAPDPRKYTFLEQIVGIVLALLILGAMVWILAWLHGILAKQFGKWEVFGWFLVAVTVCFIAAAICRIRSKRLLFRVPPEYTARYACHGSVIAIDFNALRLYLGDPNFPPRIFEAADIAAVDLLGGDARPDQTTAWDAVAKIRVHLDSVSDPMRIIGFGEVDMAMQAMRDLEQLSGMARYRQSAKG